MGFVLPRRAEDPGPAVDCPWHGVKRWVAASDTHRRGRRSKRGQGGFQKPLIRGGYTHPMHLLLVEDDPRLADLVARLLGGERHLVERAATGRDALDMAESPGLDA